MEGNTPKQVCKLPAFNTEKLQSQKRSIHLKSPVAQRPPPFSRTTKSG
jgi:hypothetical protein